MPKGMSGYLRFKGIGIFDYARWAEPLRDQVRQNGQRLAEEAGLSIEHLRNSQLRKESLVRDILTKRGEQEGLVCIFSAMEACPSYKPWHDKPSARTFLKTDTGKCLHFSEQRSGAAAAESRPTGLGAAQALAVSWVDQKNRPLLQILPDSVGATRCGYGTPIARDDHHPFAECGPCMSVIFCPRGDGETRNPRKRVGADAKKVA
jgi:hypothetical protein